MDSSNVHPKRPPFWRVAQRCCIVAGAIDVGFLFLFLKLDSPILAWVNIISVAMYFSAYHAYGRRLNAVGTALIWTEVILHAALGIVMIGWDSGFNYFLLVFIPALAVSLSPKKAVISLSALWFYYVGLYYYSVVFEPIQTLSESSLLIVNIFNLTVVFGIFAYLAFYYVLTISSVQRKLREHATTDSMTQLYNRRYMNERLKLEVEQSRVNATQLSLLLLDIDHFKQVNDKLGHDVGDNVLAHAANILRAELRPNDIASRWGGEEFLVILPESCKQDGVIVAERIRSAFNSYDWQAVTGINMQVTVSVGVHVMAPNDSLAETIKAADKALYRAKDNGRNRIEISTLAITT